MSLILKNDIELVIFIIDVHLTEETAIGICQQMKQSNIRLVMAHTEQQVLYDECANLGLLDDEYMDCRLFGWSCKATI